MTEAVVIHPPVAELTEQPVAHRLAPMIFQHPFTLSHEAFQSLGQVAKEEPLELSQGLLTGQLQVYRVGGLLAMVELQQDVLHIRAIVQTGRRGSYFRDLAVGLIRLAKSWGCGRIESYTESERVTRLLRLHGMRVGGWQLVMEL